MEKKWKEWEKKTTKRRKRGEGERRTRPGTVVYTPEVGKWEAISRRPWSLCEKHFTRKDHPSRVTGLITREDVEKRTREIEKCRREKPGEVVFLKTYFIHLPIIWIKYLKNDCFNDISLYQWQTFLRCLTYTIRLERVLLFEDNR